MKNEKLKMKGAYMGGYSGTWDFPSLYDDEDYETRTQTVRLSNSTTPMPVYEE